MVLLWFRVWFSSIIRVFSWNFIRDEITYSLIHWNIEHLGLQAGLRNCWICPELFAFYKVLSISETKVEFTVHDDVSLICCSCTIFTLFQQRIVCVLYTVPIPWTKVYFLQNYVSNLVFLWMWIVNPSKPPHCKSTVSFCILLH
jgi:hypothetical protein